MIPDLRALFADCIELLRDRLDRLERSGRIVDAWMNDPVSRQMREVYNVSVMDAPDGGYHSLRAYQTELENVHAELGRMEAEYRRIEEGNAGLFGDRS